MSMSSNDFERIMQGGNVSQALAHYGPMAQNLKRNVEELQSLLDKMPKRARGRKRNPGQQKGGGARLIKRSARQNIVTKTKSKKKGKVKSRTVRDRVRKLEVENKNDRKLNECLYIEKLTSPAQIACAVKTCSYSASYCMQRSDLVAAIDALPQATVATTPSVISTNFAAANIRPNLMVKHTKIIVFRNNWSIPCDLTLTEFACICDTTDSPFKYSEDAAADFGITGFATDPRYNLNSAFITTVRSQKYTKKVEKTFRLNAGDEVTYKLVGSSGNINVEDLDIRTQNYLKGMSRILVQRLQGVVSHDDGADDTLVNWADAKLDVIRTDTYTVRYDGNGSVKTHNTGANTLGDVTDAVVTAPNVVKVAESG